MTKLPRQPQAMPKNYSKFNTVFGGKRLEKLLKFPLMTNANFIDSPRFQRLLEILPGFTAWLVILFPIWGTFFFPKIVAYFTIAFLIFWFARSFQTAILGIRGYYKIRNNERLDWHQKYLQEKKRDSLPWEKIKHCIIIPNCNESVEKLSKTIECLASQEGINPTQIYVILAMEKRMEGARERAEELIKKFHGKFGSISATFHPAGLPGEIVGKASNEAWAAKAFKSEIIKKKLDIKNITITSCDADACFHKKYFSALTYRFATQKNRYLLFWQSPMFMHNNFWRVPAFIRIVSTLGNVIHIASLQEPDNLSFNYSTYSTSMKMLDEVGYWHTDIIPEDWHIFLQCFFEKNGKVEVEPIFLPTSIDAPEGKNYWASLKSRYEQCKRHAWGATDIPYAIKESIKHKDIPFLTRFFRVYKLMETHILWSTNWFILTLGAWLPALINPVFKQTTLGYNLPKISQTILNICLVSLFVIIILDTSLRPKVAKGRSPFFPIIEYAQWLLMPIATLLMAVLPGLESQTRLMLGKKMEYRVTEKF